MSMLCNPPKNTHQKKGECLVIDARQKMASSITASFTVFSLSSGNHWNLLPEATVLTACNCWRFTKNKYCKFKKCASCDPIRSKKWMNMWKSTKVCTAFLFMDQKTYWNQTFLNWCLKITATDLHEIGLQMKEWHFRDLSS